MKRYIGHEIKNLDILIGRKMLKLNKNQSLIILTPIQVKIIELILQKEDVFQSDLEKIFNLRRSTISGVLQTMEKNNLIIKIDTNKRSKKIVLTDYALEKSKSIKKQIKHFENQLIKDISSDELKTFLNVIDKIKLNLEN